MIDFDEELKKLHPSLELDEAEEAITKHDLSDMIDVIVGVVKETQEE